MINWKEICGLHVISKLEKMTAKWFGAEMIFADIHHKIKSAHLERGFHCHSSFFKMQLSLDHGAELLAQDIEKINEHFHVSEDKVYEFDTLFPHIKGVAAKIEVDGEFLGVVLAYPFLEDPLSPKEAKEILVKLVECGADKADATRCTEGIKRLSAQDRDYLQEIMMLVAEEVTTFHEEITKRENRITELNSELGDKYRFHSMIGKSKKMQDIYRLLEKVSKTDSSIFIQGENGTGKELVAKAIHYFSPRKESLFLAVNCSAFNDNLLDSELFGHVKGAFTGAIKNKKGLFEQAHTGTLFLDEIGDTSLSMQVKLLRVLQEGTYLPVGATTPRRADVRIVAATNRPIQEMIAKGEFREDLYYRINVINVSLPPLRDRGEDIPLLIEHFLTKRCGELGMLKKNISKKCMEKLMDYLWPGNVRECENEIERLVVLAGEDKLITPESLSPRILEHGAPVMRGSAKGISTSGSLRAALEELESIMISEGLKRCNFNKSKLSKELGISRASLIMKVEKYGLDKRKKAAGE